MMQREREPFFFWMAVVLIAVVLAGFSLPAFQQPGGPLATPLFLHFHGAVFLGWFVLLATQARLVGNGQVGLHMRLGLMSVVLAVAIVVVGYLVVRGALAKPDMRIAGRPAVYGSIFPITDIVNFVVAYSLGFLSRGHAGAHKRLMLIAAMLMIDPAMARLVFTLGWPGTLIMQFEIGLFFVLIGYDIVRLRRPHWASLLGAGLFGGAMTLKLHVESLPWWPGFVTTIFM